MPENEQLLELPALFKTLVKKMTQEWHKRVADNLSMSQFRMLFILNSGGPQKAMKLADALGVTSGAVTGMADKLIDMGIVERERDDDDRRVVFLRITDKGREMLDTLLESQKQTITAFFKSLPNEDIRHLKRIFTTLLNEIEITERE